MLRKVDETGREGQATGYGGMKASTTMWASTRQLKKRRMRDLPCTLRGLEGKYLFRWSGRGPLILTLLSMLLLLQLPLRVMTSGLVPAAWNVVRWMF